MRIPAIVCHGIRPQGSGRKNPLTAKHLEGLMRIAREMGFDSITYDDLDQWKRHGLGLPSRPILIDFDHPVRSLRLEILDILQRQDFMKANLFMYTWPYDASYERSADHKGATDHLSWSEIRDLVAAGWLIGAHTITHPNLSDLAMRDPDGEILKRELDRCNAVIAENLGVTPRDFAFTGNSWSSPADVEVRKRYRFGRLWIAGPDYVADGQRLRFADLVGYPGPDELDGGPPMSARYVTEHTDPYRLPSMDLQVLVNAPAAFRSYLAGALDG